MTTYGTIYTNEEKLLRKIFGNKTVNAKNTCDHNFIRIDITQLIPNCYGFLENVTKTKFICKKCKEEKKSFWDEALDPGKDWPTFNDFDDPYDLDFTDYDEDDDEL